MKKNTELDSPKAFLVWLREYEGIINFSEHDAALLLGYLEGHGYALYADRSRMFCFDMEGEAEYIESFQEIVHRISKWNIEMITETLYKIMEEESNAEYKKEEEYLEKLLDEEEHLADLNLKICFVKKEFVRERAR